MNFDGSNIEAEIILDLQSTLFNSELSKSISFKKEVICS